MSRYLSVTPVDQLRRQLGVRFYFMWYYIQPGIVALARKSGLTLNLDALSGYLVYFLNVILTHIYVFLDVKPPPPPPPQKKQTKFPHKGSVMDPLGVLQYPPDPQLLFALFAFFMLI